MTSAATSAWPANEIDRFILAKLEQQKLNPAPRADPRTLLRRLAYDLTGLPPTAAQIAALTKDSSLQSWSRAIDEFLSSKHYGEKWGRHWLDLVRYSDTAGFEIDAYIADAWRYRDYVIQSFNEDKPYDRFIREQLAGDEFFPEDPVAQTGTGFFCVGPNLDLYPDQADVNRVETLRDYTDTAAAVFLGLTAGCARCHDHKYDPIPQRDYYRFQAIFAPAVKTRVALNRLTSLGYEVAENIREIKLQGIGEEIGAVQQRCRKLLAERPAASRTDDDLRSCLNPEESDKLRSIERRLINMYASYRAKPFACGVTDVGDFSPRTFVPVRGSTTGTPVDPGFFTALGGGDIPEKSFERPTTGPIPLTATTGRRHALANWLVSPDNPLTARVMVNRIWQFHFGRGLVATSNDFGSRGSAPSHPELLDWLAAEFVRSGWSVKHIHRLILNSATWRQSANPSKDARDRDPENLYLSHFSRRRLDSEELRDSILAVSGSLNRKAEGRPIVPPLSKEELFNMIGRAADFWIVTADSSEYTRRSIYLFQRRTFRMPMMEVFDAPESMITCPRRDSSTTAPQSLTLLNGSFTLDQSRAFAAKLSGQYPDDSALVQSTYREILLRDPTPQESQQTIEFLANQIRNTGSRQNAATEIVRALLNLNEFLYID